LEKVSEWGFPLETDEVRGVVRDYLNATGRKVLVFGPNNEPGRDWTTSFIKRHKTLSSKLADNIKRSRAQISRDDLAKYFEELKITMSDVPPENVVNYDETAFVDDPKKSRVSVS